MDCSVVGNLIYKLRKEKHLTQQQLADKMNISDKTISKWERGLGCPDVSLLCELSNILGVDIEKILSGTLQNNAEQGGNMKNTKFYICPICGNVIVTTGNADISCCGRKLEPTKCNKIDDKHKLTIEDSGDEKYITFNHEMTKEHYISFIAYVSYDNVLIHKMYPEQNAELHLPKMYGGKYYIFCNKHGLMIQ